MYGTTSGRSDFSIFLEKTHQKAVSSHHLRHDKTCLNCGATVEERFCTRCGQENLEPKETVGHIVGHFFEDITHFDGKFFVTVKDLILRPGFLTREYGAGRRAKYLNPIRMYIFISAVFFLTLFAGKSEHQAEDQAAAAKPAKKPVAPNTESLNLAFGNSGNVIIELDETKYNTVKQYDSVQHSLPDSARDKGFMHWVLRKNVSLKETNGGREHVRLEEDVSHSIPKLMFVLLPLFALYVGWFYSRKKYYYVQHAIFSVHFHSFVFLLFLVCFLLAKIAPEPWGPIIVMVIAFLLIFVYLVAALYGMYGQSFWRSLLKGIAISLLYWITATVVSTSLIVLAFINA